MLKKVLLRPTLLIGLLDDRLLRLLLLLRILRASLLLVAGLYNLRLEEIRELEAFGDYILFEGVAKLLLLPPNVLP